MVLITIWWSQKLEKNWLYVNKQHKCLMWIDFISGSSVSLHVRERYQIKISIQFAALTNLNVNDDIISAWVNIKENIKT